MNPLSPFTYYRRHKLQALLLLVPIASLTLGVFVPAGVMYTTIGNLLHEFHLPTRVSRILAGQTLEPGTVAQLRAHPDVAAVIPENGLSISFSSWFMLESRLVLGVMEDDLEMAMETCDLRLKEGRLIEPRAAEIVLSEEIVRALGLQIGDVIGHDVDEHYYPTIATELTLVGILESVPSTTNGTFASGQAPSETVRDVQAGFVSYEYLEGHEAYQPRLSNLLIIPRPGHRGAVNDFAEALIEESGRNPSVRLVTFEQEGGFVRPFGEGIRVMFAFASGIVAVAAALVVGMVNRIAIAQRLSELGLLHAAGYEKRSLLHRLGLEIVTIAGLGWASGLLLSVMASILLNVTLATMRESVIDLASPASFLLTLPIPLAIVGWVTISVYRMLNQLDAVAIIERGKLSMEDARSRKQGKARSSHNPLSSWTYYLRHRLRSLALLASTGLMVLGVAFPAFAFTMLTDVIAPLWSYASHTSVISPSSTYQAVDPAVLAQIRSHPAVAHVIPVKSLSMATNMIPYAFQLHPAHPTGRRCCQCRNDRVGPIPARSGGRH
jgi:ABC-type lipoprotein release transport system permease subunit